MPLKFIDLLVCLIMKLLIFFFIAIPHMTVDCRRLALSNDLSSGYSQQKRWINLNVKDNTAKPEHVYTHMLSMASEPKYRNDAITQDFQQVNNRENRAQNAKSKSSPNKNSEKKKLFNTENQKGTLLDEEPETSTRCKPCENTEEIGLDDNFKDLQQGKNMHLKPAFPCDEWNEKTHTCWLNRNIGDTVTFVLSTKAPRGVVPKIIWKFEFQMLRSKATKEFIIDPENTMWNIVIGNEGHELRVSPVTEIDIDFNKFSATLAVAGSTYPSPSTKVNFQIRILPIDLGFVYPGETLELNVRSYVSLPAESIKTKWFLEENGESSSLPSNMKRSDTGELLRISELRKEQEGIIVCSVYTNLECFATKRRFLIKELENEALVVSRNRTHAYKKVADSVNNFKFLNRRKATNSIQQVSQKQAYALRGQHERDAIVKKMKTLKRWKRSVFQTDFPVFQQMNENEKTSNLEKISDSPNEAVSNQPLKYVPFDHIIKYKRQRQKSYQNKGTSSKIRERQLKSPAVEENEYNDDFLNYPIVNVHVTEEEIVPYDSNSEIEAGISQKDDQQADEKRLSIIKTDIVRKQKNKISADDKISKLITKCKKDRECSMHATCFKYNQKKLGFCKCVSGFHGNGVFCWEDTHDRNPPPLLDDNKAPVKETYASYGDKKFKHHTKRPLLDG